MVLVKDSKNKGGEFGGISVGKKLCVDFYEPLFGEEAVGTIFQESFMPLFYFFLGNCKVNDKCNGKENS